MQDPTHGRIDPDIQTLVDEMNPPTLGSRVAIENTLQARRDAGRYEDGPLRPPYDVDAGFHPGPSIDSQARALERSIERLRADIVDQLVRLSKRRGAPMPRDVRALLAGTVGGFVGIALAFGVGWALPIRPETVPAAILGAVGALGGWAVGYVWGWRR